jgi:hypothetical protein
MTPNITPQTTTFNFANNIQLSKYLSNLFEINGTK